ncbi:MAG TPA: beta-ketoacyl synthase N-terminal-like domain-containing protein [Syntrophorhabdaceae bacterium]|jgi:3-oxoacyl-[acyl-carrier-protein] synthase II
MEAFVEGIGIVGGFGSDIEEFSSALARGTSPVQSVSFPSEEGTKEMPAFLADTTGLDKFVSKKALRRVDHHAKMALLGAYLALEDAHMLDIDRASLGIVVASGYGASAGTFGFLDSFMTGTDAYSSPTHFSNSVHNAAAAYISIFLGVTGPCLTVSQFEMSVPSALISALHWLREGRVERVLFGAVDEYCDVLGYCWRRFFGVERSSAGTEPFLFDRQSAVLGEGAAFFLLSGKRERENGYGCITGALTEYRDSAHLLQGKEGLFILGADGHKESGSRYRQLITKEMNVASYAPLYGSFPTNMAFDMAAACASIKERKIFAPSAGIALPSSMNISPLPRDLGVEPICCLKLGAAGEAGIITLASRDVR